ncbi:transglutaminase-like domain-containing protein [Microbacterium sp.]|uniref:transglutaminase-like domain-containing protein n=1 Tax=Microbacterium sp. TaxID=51671 RepID=UPI0039E56F65
MIPRRRLLAGSAYAATMAGLGAIAAWPVYRSGAFLLLVGASVVMAAAIAATVVRKGWGAGAAAGLVAAAIAITGVPLAVPSRLGGPLELLGGLGELGAGLVVGWKDLLTVALPVGSYRNLLVPALVVFLVGVCAALLLSFKEGRVSYLAVLPGLAIPLFGLLFGRTTVSAPLSVGPVALFAPVESGVGVGALVAGVGWLAWRHREERGIALRRASAAGGLRVRRRPAHGEGRRVALGAGMVVVSVAAALVVAPAAAHTRERSVLRAAAGPEVELSRAVSPLAAFRAQFEEGTEGTELFRVTGTLPDRIRLATLDSYDGSVYRTGLAASGARFARVPAAVEAGPGAPLDVQVQVAGLEGLWMPTAGALESVEFVGAHASALADGFYYSDSARAAVQTFAWHSGDRYRLRAVEPATADLASAQAPGGAVAEVEPPVTLRAWMDEHVQGSGGAALAGLVALLRERGYLSHALSIGEEPPAWAAGLDGYRFQPSAAGHSLGRIEELFRALLEREADPRVAASGDAVAAIGDDEQFAVAVALMAQELGFPARIVVGARLQSADADLPSCEGNVCRAGDLAAWVEVRTASDQWIPIDVTPQHERFPSLEVTQQRDPEVATQVRPDAVAEVAPPRPAQDDDVNPDERPDDAVDLSWLWPVLRVAGAVAGVVVVLLGPFLLVVGAKALRRRARRRRPDPAARIAGGWDEYLDATADAGRHTPRRLTRLEAAASIEGESATLLATAADRAVFSAGGATADEADEYWRLVDAERRAIPVGRWQRLRSAVSLRSFLRLVEPRRVGTPAAERRSRSSARRRRTLS